VSKELKSRLEKAHTLENVKRTIPNFIKMMLIFVTGLAIDPHTGVIDTSIFGTLLEVWKQYQIEIIGIVTLVLGQDFYRKRG